MDFKTATDRATAARITLADIASEADVSDSKVRRARLDPSGPEYRSPPDGWENVLARLARKRAKDLQTLAADLEHPG